VGGIASEGQFQDLQIIYSDVSSAVLSEALREEMGCKFHRTGVLLDNGHNANPVNLTALRACGTLGGLPCAGHTIRVFVSLPGRCQNRFIDFDTRGTRSVNLSFLLDELGPHRLLLRLRKRRQHI
jgi:hypothetical protein